MARQEKRKTSSATNTAETAKSFGTLGATIAGAGTLGLATATVAATLAAFAATGFGYVLLLAAALIRHMAMEKSYDHQEAYDAYSDGVGELK